MWLWMWIWQSDRVTHQAIEVGAVRVERHESEVDVSDRPEACGENSEADWDVSTRHRTAEGSRRGDVAVADLPSG